ncbi:MAG TPA: DUF4340 domain-containing protein [Polyangiales bacterium]|nr:DUF4340 domain-containing protein [Polyangiales bacterium]
MSGNKNLVAFVVLAALLGITVWQFKARDAEDQRTADVSVTLPKLKKEDVDELSISSPEKTPVTFKKVDSKWRMTAPVQTEADSSAIDTALSKLAEIEVIGVAATKPENHAALEVVDGKAIHVTAKGADKPLLDLLIGVYRSGNTIAREPSNNNAAVIKGSVRYAFDKVVKDWRDRTVTGLTAEQVAAITFQNKDGTFNFVKEGSEWKQAPIDKKIPNFESGKIVSLVGTATSMRANDFAPEDATADSVGVGAKPVGKVTITTSGDAGSQQVVLLVGNKRDDGYYLKNEAKAPIYVVSDFAGSRMLSGPDKFVKDEPGKVVEVNPIAKKKPSK